MCSPQQTPPKVDWHKVLHSSGDGSKGLAGRSCHVSACLHLLCRTSSHLYSRHRQAVAWQPSLRDSRQWDPALTAQSICSTSSGQESLWTSDGQSVTKSRVKAALPVKYNKTHCWNCYCASYSTLFLVVLTSSLTVSWIYPQPCGTAVCSVLPFASQASLHSCCIKPPDIPARHRRQEQLVVWQVHSVNIHNVRP